MFDMQKNESVFYKVVVNHEGQYSIWLQDLCVPKGWREINVNGSKAHCLDYIEKNWLDMRPLSFKVSQQRKSGFYL